MKAGKAVDELLAKLESLYDKEEARNIANMVVAFLLDEMPSQRAIWQDRDLTEPQINTWRAHTKALMEHRPVQYVLGEAYFYGLKLSVGPGVLIPRPETEELVHWALDDCRRSSLRKGRFLDIGTGSGCMALVLKKQLPEAEVEGWDVSEKALSIARHNGSRLGLGVHWHQKDILSETIAQPIYDMIISNPPYIKREEADSLEEHVYAHEPETALFVSNGDPLQFYKAIERFSRKGLRENGVLYLELHSLHASETYQYFMEKGWLAEMKLDFQGRPRMLRCRLTDRTCPAD